MKDITNYNDSINVYGGSETKKTYYIDNKKYMVKFPVPVKEELLPYLYNVYSEYIGCKIFELFNINVQNVELVKCHVNNKDKIAVMCEDFLNDDELLIEFKTLSYSISTEKVYTNEISDIFEMIDNITSYKDRDKFKSKFWDIFVVDTLIGNVDRHLGNLGIIINGDVSRLSPVYDCGSCLHPLFSDEYIESILNTSEIKNVSINLKTAYKYKGKTLNYKEAYDLNIEGLSSAVKRIYPLIDLDKIKNIIYNIDSLSIKRKEFYFKTIEIRKREILDKYFNKVRS